MGYETEVRVITTQKGFRELNKFADMKLKENIEVARILKEPDINEKYKDIVRLGWTDMRSSELEVLKDCMTNLMEKDITYRALYLGENLEDIEESCYTSQNDKKAFIPYISLIRTFDDEEDKKQLDIYVKENSKEDEMECE